MVGVGVVVGVVSVVSGVSTVVVVSVVGVVGVVVFVGAAVGGVGVGVVDGIGVVSVVDSVGVIGGVGVVCLCWCCCWWCCHRQFYLTPLIRFRIKTTNPLDYTYASLNVNFEVLDHENPEFEVFFCAAFF